MGCITTCPSAVLSFILAVSTLLLCYCLLSHFNVLATMLHSIQGEMGTQRAHLRTHDIYRHLLHAPLTAHWPKFSCMFTPLCGQLGYSEAHVQLKSGVLLLSRKRRRVWRTSTTTTISTGFLGAWLCFHLPDFTLTLSKQSSLYVLCYQSTF
jgi:hypothetical protein